MSALIAVVDYCKGNLANVQRGLADAGYDARITQDPKDILCADGIVLPGVGSFADAMTTMNRSGQTHALKDAVRGGVPFLGICLGVHLIFDWGDEGCEAGARMDGFGFLPGHVERVAAYDAQGKKHKVPHVGWNSVEYVQDNPLFEGIPDGSFFYFTHSYCAMPASMKCAIATTTHAQTFASAVAQENIFGVQFHPEKSSRLGLRPLENFGDIVKSA